jgi:hypothetical protein
MPPFAKGEDPINCEKCGQLHIVSYIDYPEKDRSEISCLVPGCGGIVIKGRSTREYISARLPA